MSPMPRASSVVSLAMTLVCLGIVLTTTSRASDRIGGSSLVRVYGQILDADFEGAARTLETACPPAPAEACLVLDAIRILWRIQMDPPQTRFDHQFTATVSKAIDAADAWAAREPQNADAWFYVGVAYGARVQWRVLRGSQLAAARDGRRIKQALDTALKLDPTLHDAQFGLGLYEYYADVAPRAAKFLRFLLMLPGGDRARGLARMQKAREEGVLLAGEAAYQLHQVYLWYERRPDDALGLLRELARDHQANPVFHRLIAATADVYFHDAHASLAAYRRLAQLARTGRVNEASLALVEARLGMAAQLEALGDTDLALAELVQVVAADPDEPYAAAMRARLALAQGYDRIGQWSTAARLYREVIAGVKPPDPLGLVGAARRGLARPTDFTKGESRRLALAAWRTFERDQNADVERQFQKALALDASNTVARYRYGRVLAARDRANDALAAFEAVVRAASSTPAAIVAEAALAAGQLRERSDDPNTAIDRYRTAARTLGASADTKAAAERALARLARASRP
jgi:tetratricopeptide (TPR) repeat protein